MTEMVRFICEAISDITAVLYMNIGYSKVFTLNLPNLGPRLQQITSEL